MNFVDYTVKLIGETEASSKILVIGAGFKLDNIDRGIIQNDPDMDLNDWIDNFRNSKYFMNFDYVILSRVLEHFPQRSVDWYLYNLYTIMKKGSQLICIVPDMYSCALELSNEFRKEQPNMFRVNRLTYELLSEGDHVWDRHATWTCENSIKTYLEMEGLFKVSSIKKVRIDSDIVPSELEVLAIRR